MGAVKNLDARGEPFSIRGDGCLRDNATAYRWLVEKGYFEEAERVIDGEPTIVIFMSQELLDKVKARFEKKFGK